MIKYQTWKLFIEVEIIFLYEATCITYPSETTGENLSDATSGWAQLTPASHQIQDPTQATQRLR